VDTTDVDAELARCELTSEILSADESPGNTLVFANSIASASALFDFLRDDKKLPNCALFHKEVPNSERQEVLRQLDDASANVTVVCTDIAARGLDTTKVRSSSE
jgi:superfamily II DNA/RNA helicase